MLLVIKANEFKTIHEFRVHRRGDEGSDEVGGRERGGRDESTDVVVGMIQRASYVVEVG